jgi:hypothetical protein
MLIKCRRQGYPNSSSRAVKSVFDSFEILYGGFWFIGSIHLSVYVRLSYQKDHSLESIPGYLHDMCLNISYISLKKKHQRLAVGDSKFYRITCEALNFIKQRHVLPFVGT